MINSNRIKGRLVEMGMTNKDVAKELNLALSTVSQKINNIRPMTLTEAEKLRKLLKIKDSEFTAYFFYNDVALCNLREETVG